MNTMLYTNYIPTPGGTSSKKTKQNKNPPANAGNIRDVDLVPGSGRSPGGWHDNPL